MKRRRKGGISHENRFYIKIAVELITVFVYSLAVIILIISYFRAEATRELKQYLSERNYELISEISGIRNMYHETEVESAAPVDAASGVKKTAGYKPATSAPVKGTVKTGTAEIRVEKNKPAVTDKKPEPLQEPDRPMPEKRGLRHLEEIVSDIVDLVENPE